MHPSVRLFLPLGALFLLAALGWASPGPGPEPPSKKLSCRELLYLLAYFPELNTESVHRAGHLGDFLAAEIESRGAQPFLSSLVEFLHAQEDFVFAKNSMFPLRVDAIARRLGGESAEKARFLMLFVGSCADSWISSHLLPSTAAIGRKYLKVPLEEIVGKSRVEKIRKLKTQDLESQIQSAPPREKSPPEEPEISPLELYTRGLERRRSGKPRPAVPAGDFPSIEDWLWIYWNLDEDSRINMEVARSLPRLLDDVPDEKIAGAVIRFLCSEEYSNDAFWGRVDAFLRTRKSEAAGRARYTLLLSGVVPGHREPFRRGNERWTLLKKYRETRLVDLVGEERIPKIQDLCAGNWIGADDQSLAIEILSRMMTPVFRKKLLRKKDSLFTEPNVRIFAAIARSEGKAGLRSLEKRVAKEEFAAFYAFLHIPPGEALPVLRRIYEKSEFPELVLWVLGRMDLSKLPGEDREFIYRLIEELLDNYEFKSDSQTDSGSGEDYDNGERLRAAGELLGALGRSSCDRLLEMVKGFRLDRISYAHIGFDTKTTYAEDRIVELCGTACGKRAVPEILRLLRHREAVVRSAALRALDRADPGIHDRQVLPLLDDPDPAVQLEAATYISRSDPSSRDAPMVKKKALKIFREAFSPENPFQWTFHYIDWGPYEFEQYERAARGFHRFFPAEALAAFETILDSLVPETSEPGTISLKGILAWPLLLPLYIELSAIDWDDPFPLEYLGVTEHWAADVILEELKRRKANP